MAPDYSYSGKFDKAVLMGTGVILGTGLLLRNQMEISQQCQLQPEKLISIDRCALRYSHAASAHLSDVALICCSALPFAVMFIHHTNIQDMGSNAVLILETQGLSAGFTFIAKALIHRPRPYAYHPEDFGITALTSDAVRSFYSGHTALAFSGACLAGSMINHYDHEQWRKPIWITGLASASLTGAFRVFSGRHFPTDVIAGALAGSVLGFIIPAIHTSN